MRGCWNDEPTARPSFDQLVDWIDSIISKARLSSRVVDDSHLYLNITQTSYTVAEPPNDQRGSAITPGAAGTLE